ncbi:MAG TPA: cytochrome c [Vicinamibacterales bacterium]|nr:cytochrome c [Vicinamibacterales bacterium]
MRRARIILTRGIALAVVAGAWLGIAAVVTVDATPQAQTPAAAATAPTFSKDVAPIFYTKCVTCHRPGEVAPMSLITFQEVRPWVASIRDKVSSRVMPPWHADRQHGRFRNEQSLTQSEIDTIVAWAGAGAREGNPTELPALPKFPEGWQIGTPDVVFTMPGDYQIPARGTIDYQYFEVPTGFTEDKWMQAGEVRAGDRAHVHHIIVSVREPQRSTRPNVVTVTPIFADGQTPTPRVPRAQAAAPDAAAGAPATRRGGDNMIVNWAVGEDAPVHAPGTAKFIPAGSTLIFQVHYTTNGTPGTDRSRIGLIFAKQPPTREVRTGSIANPLFALPPGAANHQVESVATFSEDVKVWSMHPHMHLRGKDMTYTAIYPDGRREIVLRVPKFDFGWQTDYWLAEPLVMPKGSKLHVSAHFDNSAANRANPDPTATVRWGDQTWEEMMIGFFTYTVEGPVPTSTTARR